MIKPIIWLMVCRVDNPTPVILQNLNKKSWIKSNHKNQVVDFGGYKMRLIKFFPPKIVKRNIKAYYTKLDELIEEDKDNYYILTQ